jgi:hypothetical protein
MEKKIFNLHDALISQGFRHEANEIIKLAKVSLVADIISEAEENMSKVDHSGWKTKISKTDPVSTNEMKSILLSLGCEEAPIVSGEGGHDKFLTDTISKVKTFLNDPENYSLVPAGAANYFINTLEQIGTQQIRFFMTQRGVGSFVPGKSLLSGFWRFVKCLAAAKILLDKYISSISIPANPAAGFDRGESFQILLSKKRDIEDKIRSLYSEKEFMDENKIFELMEEEDRIDKEIQNFWITP